MFFPTKLEKTKKNTNNLLVTVVNHMWKFGIIFSFMFCLENAISQLKLAVIRINGLLQQERIEKITRFFSFRQFGKKIKTNRTARGNGKWKWVNKTGRQEEMTDRERARGKDKETEMRYNKANYKWWFYSPLWRSGAGYIERKTSQREKVTGTLSGNKCQGEKNWWCIHFSWPEWKKNDRKRYEKRGREREWESEGKEMKTYEDEELSTQKLGKHKFCMSKYKFHPNA